MKTTWHQAVLSALTRFSLRHQTIQIERAPFLAEELDLIIQQTDSAGRTPSQTVSRVLQELRDEGNLFFSNTGIYTFNRVEVDAAKEDFPDDVLENAAETGNLSIGDIYVSDEHKQTRVRKGMNALRSATLKHYRNSCALCDVSDTRLLVTSHIARWADRPEARGKLSNLICYCSLHDKLFEHGYFSLLDTYQIRWRSDLNSKAINIWRNECTKEFSVPLIHPPAHEFLKEHRNRVGL